MPVNHFTAKVSAFIGQDRIPVEINFAERLRITIRAPWRNRIVSEGAFSLGDDEAVGWFTRDRFGKETVPTTFIAILEEAVSSLNTLVSQNIDAVGKLPFASDQILFEDFSEIFTLVQDMVRTVYSFGSARQKDLQDLLIVAAV